MCGNPDPKSLILSDAGIWGRFSEDHFLAEGQTLAEDQNLAEGQDFAEGQALRKVQVLAEDELLEEDEFSEEDVTVNEKLVFECLNQEIVFAEDLEILNYFEIQNQHFENIP